MRVSRSGDLDDGVGAGQADADQTVAGIQLVPAQDAALVGILFDGAADEAHAAGGADTLAATVRVIDPCRQKGVEHELLFLDRDACRTVAIADAVSHTRLSLTADVVVGGLRLE